MKGTLSRIADAAMDGGDAASSPAFAGEPVLVTGASGFVGSAVARALARRAARLRLLVRPTSPRGNIEDLEAEIAVGDMRDRAAVRRALCGCRYLFHVAADYRLWARDPQEIVRNNVEGVKAMLAEAADAGVERIVYTSSVATLAPGADGSPADESVALAESDAVGAYKRSKVAAERLVEHAAAEGLPVVIVNPSTPIGPHDIKPTPTGRIIVEAASGRMPAFVDTGLNIVHVDDVAEGHLLAMEKGRAGERYILGGQDVSLRDMLARLAELAGRRPPRLGLPIRPLYPLAEAAELLGRLTGKAPFLTRDALTMAAHHMYFSSEKARRELGYDARPYELALHDALAWFRAQGYVR